MQRGARYVAGQRGRRWGGACHTKHSFEPGTVSPDSNRWAAKITQENSLKRSGVVRAIARSDHWRWVSRPRWARASWKVTSNCQRNTNHWII